MTNEAFWKLIALVDTARLDEGDEDSAVSPLERELHSLPADELKSFAEHLARSLYDIDGSEFAAHSGESGDSDDAFLYARCYVVAKGRQHYQTVLADPSKMPKTLDHWCESILYIHRHAWATITKREESDWPYETEVSYESGSNESLWQK